jgi:pyruvate/2-oxoacid:ferredoxin oxidoreductase beta subunit
MRVPPFCTCWHPAPKDLNINDRLTLETGRLAVKTGKWCLYEWDNGVYKHSPLPEKYKPVREYMEFQGRFRHLKAEQIAKMRAFVSEKIQWIKAIAVEAHIATPKAKA